MTAARLAALTVYDMVKGLERGVRSSEVALLEKSRRTRQGLAPMERLSSPIELVGARRGRGGVGAAAGRPLQGGRPGRLARTVADDRGAIAGVLKRLANQEQVRFVFTTGGTGLTVDDVTPEATRDVIDREAPGYAEAIRADSRDHTPLGCSPAACRGCAGER